jgi:hypothetical protein
MSNIQTDPKQLNNGIIWVPYIIKTECTYINGEVVWYANRWKNIFLKIKHFFIKPKYKKMNYLKKPINTKYYTTIKINE